MTYRKFRLFICWHEGIDSWLWILRIYVWAVQLVGMESIMAASKVEPWLVGGLLFMDHCDGAVGSLPCCSGATRFRRRLHAAWNQYVVIHSETPFGLILEWA